MIKEAYEKGVIDAFLDLGFEKKALIGPLTDLGLMGVPSVGAYGGGVSVGAKGENPDKDSTIKTLLKYLLIPGYTGYRLGKEKGYELYQKENK